MRVGSLYSGLLTKEDLQVHTQHIVSILPQCRHDDDAMFCWWIEHVVSGVCRWFVSLYTSIHSPPALIYPCFAAADARGVACAALQGTPFSSTHSSSTADLKRLQSLGGIAFSKILLEKTIHKSLQTVFSRIHDFRFPDRRKNWELLHYFCFWNNYCKRIIIFGPKNVPPLQLYLWQIWSILKTVFMNKALWSLCTKSWF